MSDIKQALADGLIKHNCPVEGEMMIEEGKPCNWCDGMDGLKPLGQSIIVNGLLFNEFQVASFIAENQRLNKVINDIDDKLGKEWAVNLAKALADK